MDAIKNFAKATVADGNYDDTATEIDVSAGQGVRLPAAPCNAVWWNAGDFPDPSDDPNVEIVRITDISTDTLTISRGQEGTDAVEHNLPGKTYQLIAGLTAKTIGDMVGDVFGTGPAFINASDAFTPFLQVRWDGARFIHLDGTAIEIQSTRAYLGDLEGQGNSGALDINDSISKATFNNLDLATTQVQSASVAVGTLAGKLPVYDGAGVLVGYIPIYNSIT